MSQVLQFIRAYGVFDSATLTVLGEAYDSSPRFIMQSNRSSSAKPWPFASLNWRRRASAIL